MLGAGLLQWGMTSISFARHQFPPDVIRHAVWLYRRFTLSYRDVEDMLAERGLDLTYETVRRWVTKFGPLFAKELRKRRPRPTSRWHLDEMVVKIAGKRNWAAGDHQNLAGEGEPECLTLTQGQGDAGPRLEPGDCLFQVDLGQVGRPAARVRSRSAMACSARYKPERKMQRRSATVSATTVPSCSSSSSAVMIRPDGTSISAAVSLTSSSSGKPQWPSSIASASP